MKNKRKTRYRITSFILIVTMMSTTMVGDIFAGPPTINTDETLYVNLDYYGKTVDSSVVKGVSLNGLRTFTDYGSYTDVTNMSNNAQPVKSEGEITWQLPENSKERFYYECQLNREAVVLPWNFDISYKLNGIPREAKDLVHADGLVEMDIHCIPNQESPIYYRNNMLLQAASLVNMEDVSSVNAPGSQTQSIGTYKAMVFAAVPGEEKTFHIEIATRNFESMGVLFLMIPGTLEQMDELSDIRDVKNTMVDSTDELLDGMSEILGTLESISNGMTVAGAGLSELQKARTNLDASKNGIVADADNSLDSLEAVNGKISQLAPDINTNKQSLDAVNQKVNAVVKTLSHSGNDFFDMADQLSNLQDLLGDLRHSLSDVDQTAAEKNLQKVQKQLEVLQDILNQILGMAGEMPTELSEEDMSTMGMEDVSGIDKLIQAARLLAPIVSGLQNLTTQMERTLSGLDIKGGLKEGQNMMESLEAIMGSLETLIGNVNDLNRTINENKPAFDIMLDDMSASIEQVSLGTGQSITLLKNVQNTAKNNRSTVENGTEQMLNGLIDILGKAVVTKAATGKLKGANEDIRTGVKDELNKIENNTNLLEMNTQENRISFTSDNNPSPSSIQIVLRTQEISEENINTNAVDIEPEAEDVGLWKRIVNVFKKIKGNHK